jgi:DNA polymerase-1
MNRLARKVSAADSTLQTVLNRLDDPSSNELAFDTETSGLDWRYNAIVGYVITFGPDPRDSYYIPVRHGGGGNVGGAVGLASPTSWDRRTILPGERLLLKALLRKGRKLIGHNLAFDLKFTYCVAGLATFLPSYEDTIVNEPLIDEFAGKFSLEACANRRKVQAKKGEILYQHIAKMFPGENILPTQKSAMPHYWRLAGDDPVAVEYATGDGTTTWQLRDAQRSEIVKPVEFMRRNGEPIYTTLEKVHDIESRLIPVLARMTCKGIKVDVGYFEQLRDQLNAQITDMLQDFPDPDNASAQAPSDVQWYMEKHGVTDWPMTPKTKKPSFPESWLEQSKPGRRIIAIRRVTHMRNSFINPLLDEHIWNGRVHANFSQMRNDEFGTIIGRLSCDSPNLQQAHKRDRERGRMLRGGFIPDEGMVYAEADYRQCEPTLLAYYSRCKVLLDGYRNDPKFDAHTGVTRAMNLSKGYDTWDKAQQKDAREYGKRINQTLITGGGKGVIVQKYKVDPREVDQQYVNYFRAMPEIKTTQKAMERVFRQRGFMVTLLGRRLHLPSSDRSYVALNRILSGGNADVIKSKMVEIDDYLESESRPPVDILNTIHDAVDFQFDNDYRHVYNRCLDIMTRFGPDDLISLDVPMRIDSDEGRTWAEATFGV